MTESTQLMLTTNIAAVPGVSDRHAEAFRRLGIRCVADLVLHLPLRYEHELAEQTIADMTRQAKAAGGGDLTLSVCGEVVAVRSVPGRGRRRVEATVQDDTGAVRLTWFNMPWVADKLRPGLTVRVTGRAGRHRDLLQMVNPRWELLDTAKASPEKRPERYRPVYPASDELPSWQIERAVNEVLDAVLAELEDHLHEPYRASRALPGLADAYRMMHRPADTDEPLQARRRLALDELLLLQLGVMLKRRHRRRTLRAPALKHSAAIDRHIVARFPFELTASQRDVIDDIAADLCVETPMNRLLQGDVGAGKTVVALYGMLMAVAAGHQAALMAPTELLAEQHGDSIGRMLDDARVTTAVLTGSLTAAQRRSVLKRLEAGEIDLLIGTHALLTEHVRFKSLALAVVDEQHRFGVHQRATIRSKARSRAHSKAHSKGGDDNTVPHTLVMTATPIPRTLSLTIFGDLDVSTIRGMPPGRRPVGTTVRELAAADEVYRDVARRLEKGEQAYIVVPVIDESDLGLTDVHSHLETLSRGHLRGRSLAALHGRLSRDERDDIMGRFRSGDIDALLRRRVRGQEGRDDGFDLAGRRGYCSQAVRDSPRRGPAHRPVHRHAHMDHVAAGVQGRPQEIQRKNPGIDSDGVA